MAVNLQDLKRPILSIDSRNDAAQPGEPIVLMGYATGLAALLARTNERYGQANLQLTAEATFQKFSTTSRAAI